MAQDEKTAFMQYNIERLSRDLAPQLTKVLADREMEDLILAKNQIIADLRTELANSNRDGDNKTKTEKIKQLENNIRNLRNQNEFLQGRNEAMERSMRSYWNQLAKDNTLLREQLGATLDTAWRRLSAESLAKAFTTQGDQLYVTADFADWTAKGVMLFADHTWVVTNVETAEMAAAPAIVENADNSIHGITKEIGTLAAGRYRCQFLVRNFGDRNAALWVSPTTGTDDAIHETFFDINDKKIEKVRTLGDFEPLSAEIQEFFADWHLASVEFSAAAAMDTRLTINIRHPNSKSSRYAGNEKGTIAISSLRIHAI